MILDRAKPILRSGGGLAGCALLALAVSLSPAQADETQPGVFATVGAQLGYEDNAWRTADDEQSSTTASFSPRLGWIGFFSKHSLLVTYAGDYGMYFDDHDLDYADHAFKGDLQLDLAPKLKTELTGGYKLGHDAPAADRYSAIRQMQKWDEKDFDGKVTYGRRAAKAQVSVEGGYLERRYDDNIDGPTLAQWTTAAARRAVRSQLLSGVGSIGAGLINSAFPLPAVTIPGSPTARDHDASRLVGTFFWNLGPKTQLLAEVTRYDQNYLHHFFDVNYQLDSSEWRYQLGATWKATAKTTGEFRIGYFKRDMEAEQLADSSGLTYQLRLNWQPKTYSTVSLLLQRATDVTWNPQYFDIAGLSTPLGTGGTSTDSTGYFIGTTAGLSWSHELTRRWTLDTGLQYDKDEYRASSARQDDVYNFHFGIEHKLGRRTRVGLRYAYSERNSDLAGADYSANSYMLTLSTDLR